MSGNVEHMKFSAPVKSTKMKHTWRQPLDRINPLLSMTVNEFDFWRKLNLLTFYNKKDLFNMKREVQADDLTAWI